ncbi:hypothetical protein TorRG33x02_279090 [Trema orientale]|uniref:Transmembrane protein n=1 Tax=Trema orientale TaxID=63057 RepID=A0A2P5CMZ6_TREOI|nr:hypothetical protein TorRG33x02_279090 [Trema orientale]
MAFDTADTWVFSISSLLSIISVIASCNGEDRKWDSFYLFWFVTHTISVIAVTLELVKTLKKLVAAPAQDNSTLRSLVWSAAV